MIAKLAPSDAQSSASVFHLVSTNERAATEEDTRTDPACLRQVMVKSIDLIWYQ